MMPRSARAGGRASVDRAARPPSGPPPSLRLPEFERFRTASGLDVRTASRTDVPEVSLRLVLEGGASGETAATAGLAELTGRLLSEGAAGRDARETAAWLDRLGASFHAAVGYETATVSMHFLREVTAEALEFLAAVLREPHFDASEVERVRSERLDEIARERDEPSVVADHRLIRAIYGAHLYGRPVGGCRDSVESLDREAIVSFHRTRYGPTDGGLVVCGCAEPAELRRKLESLLGDWPRTAGRTVGEPPPEWPAAAGRVILVDRPGSPQAELRVGAIGAPYGTPDHHAVLLANAILGGLFNSRINMNLREEKGWTYGARSTFRFRRRAGPFVVRTAVETEVTAAAFREVLQELAGLRERPPTEKELQLAKNALTLSLPLEFETNSQVARKVARQIAYDLPEEYWARFREEIERVTCEEVVGVAERYLALDRLVLVAVTDASSVRADLESLGPVERHAPA
ncbi:MAG: M16 family metallopeptidase [Gemmatimonadota bacterium]